MLNIGKFIGKFVKNSSQKELDRLKFIIKKINEFEPKVKNIPSEDFTTKTNQFKSLIKKGQKWVR